MGHFRTRFQNRAGTQVGFAPEACDGSNVIPYCYDAAAIEIVEARIDALCVDLVLLLECGPESFCEAGQCVPLW